MTRSAWVMPGSATMSSRTRSPTVFKVRSPTSPATATLITWRRTTTSWITGSSASSGKVEMASTRVLTSLSSRCTSAPSCASMVTVPAFSAEVEWTSSIPSRPCTASSTRITTPSSTSSGAAPG